MIYFSELICRDFAHEKVNSAFIRDLLQFNKKDHAVLYSQKNHYECIKQELLNDSSGILNRLNFIDARVKSYKYDFQWWFFDSFKIYRLLNIMKKKGDENLFFLSITTGQLYWLKFFLPFFKRIRTHIVLHGILEELNFKPSLKPWKFPFWFGFAFNERPFRRLKYIIISPHIQEQLDPSGKRYDINYIHLPYCWNKKRENFIPFKDNQVNICTIGFMTEKKGRENLKILINSLHRDNIDFIFTGYGETELKPISSKLVLHEHRFDRNWLDEEINKQDYLLMPYQKKAYTLMVSGIFFDALNYEIPLIAMKCPFNEFYFKLLGNIGYLVDSVEDMDQLIRRLANEKPIDEYHKQVINLRTAKQTLDLERKSMYETFLVQKENESC